MASLDFMLNRLTIVLVLCGLSFGGCKKANRAEKSPQLSNLSPAPSVGVAAARTPSPTPAKPPIDQNAQVIVFGYHRLEKKVRRPDTEITPEAFEAQMKDLQDHKI